MDRRQSGEDNYRQKFEAFGLSTKFEFIRREWSKAHDKRFWSRCKTCGAEFLSWDEVFRGRQSRLICPKCGAASDGADIWTRSPDCDEAMAFYAAGHSVRETAEKFNVEIFQVNNEVKRRRLSNGRHWQTVANENRHNAAIKAYKEYLKQGNLDYKKIKNHHKARAVKYGCEYDPSVDLDKLIERDGLRCAICGELCDPNDHSWSEWMGPLSPSIDHIIPMSKGGGHIWSNVQVAHMICNILKSNKGQ